MQADLKTMVKEYWDDTPCGTRGIAYPEGSREYYKAIADNRRKIERAIPKLAEFERWRGKKVLEVGCGIGMDLMEFAVKGALVTGVDLSAKSVMLARKQLEVCGLTGEVLEADAEKLPFDDGTFDMVYSFGVLHHTVNPTKAINEIHRVLKPNGRVRIMLYHKPSIVCLQMYLMFGLMRGRLFLGIDEILARHHESIGTKAYTTEQAWYMFSMFRGLKINTVVTAYDIRYARGRYLPMWFRHLMPHQLGWNILVRARK